MTSPRPKAVDVAVNDLVWEGLKPPTLAGKKRRG
jgi:hypothetical protein